MELLNINKSTTGTNGTVYLSVSPICQLYTKVRVNKNTKILQGSSKAYKVMQSYFFDGLFLTRNAAFHCKI